MTLEQALAAKGFDADATVSLADPDFVAFTRDLLANLEAAEAREPVWIVNDNAELGVKLGDRFFFLYKGGNLEYEFGLHDDDTPMKWRIVGKREFGECCHPLKLVVDNIQHGIPYPHPYTQELLFDPLLSYGKKEDGDWRELPPHEVKP